MGAFVTLLYGLTAAPAAQPLNAVVGQAMAMVISIFVSQSNLDLHYKQSIATGLTIFLMVKLGVTHPPAGASALVYASENFGWGNMAFSLIAVWVAILTASFTNLWWIGFKQIHWKCNKSNPFDDWQRGATKQQESVIETTPLLPSLLESYR